ncbi:MAG: hypothetical protein ACE5JS_22580 [Nitrospinota bacterium]
MIGKALALVLLALLLSACASIEPLAFPESGDEIPPGPGLFSGPDGEFVIYRKME